MKRFGSPYARSKPLLFLALLLVPETAAVGIVHPNPFLLVFLGGAVMAWSWAEYGALPGLFAFVTQLVLIFSTLSKTYTRPDLYVAASVWWGGIGLYFHIARNKHRKDIRSLIWERDRIKGDVNTLRHEIERREKRLLNSKRWLERLSGLVNLAEEILPIYKPSELASTLRNGVPNLLPPADRFFFFHLGDDRLELLACRVPEGETSPVPPDDLDNFVMEEMKPVLVEDASHHPPEQQHHPAGSIIASPLTARVIDSNGIIGRRALGLLRVEALAPGTYGREDLEILNVIADLAARSLLNAGLYERAEELAVRDGLTGLFLRQVFYERATQDLSRARRQGTQVCLAFFDIDDFKRFNDTWGHAAGDLVLKRTASILAEEAAPGEIACRYGGEELALLLHQDVSRASRRVLKILERARSEKYILPDDDGHLQEAAATLSAGLAAFPLHADELVTLIQKADRALYRAKRMGKDRLVVARSR